MMNDERPYVSTARPGELREETMTTLERFLVAFVVLVVLFGAVIYAVSSDDQDIRPEVVEFATSTTGETEAEAPAMHRVEALLYGIPGHWTDRREPYSERMMRLNPYARAIAVIANGDLRKAARLSATAFEESKFAAYVVEDRCHEGPEKERECDGGFAYGIFQINRLANPDAKSLFSEERTFGHMLRETSLALTILDAGAMRCTPRAKEWPGVVGYRGRCNHGDNKRRETTAKVFLWVLENGWPKVPTGYSRDPNPSRAVRVKARNCTLLEPGTVTELGELSAGLTEWHFNDARGWHSGCSVLKISSETR